MYICFTSCLLVPTDQHLNEYNLMEGTQRGARTGCSDTVDNLLINRTMTLDCHRRRGNQGMAWIDVKKAYDSVDHGCLNKVMLLHRFPVWLCRVIAKICRSGNTRVVAVTRKGRETSQPIMFNRGLPHQEMRYICPRLFNECSNPIAWNISATEGYRLSKPISFKVTDLLYIDDLKIFAASERKLNWVMNMVKTTMEHVGLAWNSKKCAVVHVRRVSDNSSMI